MSGLLDAVERTTLLTAALRAAESRRPDHLFEDPYAEALSGGVGAGLPAEVRAATFPKTGSRTLPSTPDYNAIRTRFLDDHLPSAARDPQVRHRLVIRCVPRLIGVPGPFAALRVEAEPGHEDRLTARAGLSEVLPPTPF